LTFNSKTIAKTSTTKPTNTQIINNSSIEIDNQFILRMPVIKQDNGSYKLHESTLALRELIEKAAGSTDPDLDPLKDRLFIELNTDTRKGRVKFDDHIFEARLVDLPCIVESLKTVDRKAFFKTGDICQMLVCRSQDDEPWSDQDEAMDPGNVKKTRTNKAQYYDPMTNPAHGHLKKYQWPHGITPPLKNVRRKRFRKVARKKMVDYADIEKEVKQLFRADRDAVKVDYEVRYPFF
jgi:transcription initiation factor TFIID subunit 7